MRLSSKQVYKEYKVYGVSKVCTHYPNPKLLNWVLRIIEFIEYLKFVRTSLNPKRLNGFIWFIKLIGHLNPKCLNQFLKFIVFLKFECTPLNPKLLNYRSTIVQPLFNHHSTIVFGIP
jgi:hypothetical protein